ncbi:hypothetical protein O181_062259 [Austropuccinia psidii MF-1]|uniref:Reverse transcriptase domain-containing protein n=1 Tax=Austropuccinia psidii MF-1 TaxID=1389203 RepID=A0A9Q3EK15_9BASI|nr:hypothetical protein [Austropuccinia psidii MF-1]
MDKTVQTLQEGHPQLRKASEETNKVLNLVFEEQKHSKRDRDFLDQDINKLFNVYYNLKPQPQGHAMENPYHQEDIKPDAIWVNKARSPSQYQDGDNMSYSEKDTLKQLPEASIWRKFSGTGRYDNMELIYYIDGIFINLPSIPDKWITARLNIAFKLHDSIWYTEMKEIHGRRNWPWCNSQIIQKYSNVARNYLGNHFPNWEKQLFPTKAKNFKSTSGKMNSIGTTIKEITIPHRKGNIRLNPEFVVLDDVHIQGFLLGKDYQRMYSIDIYNSKNRHITIGTNKEKEFSLDIYQISSQDPLEELLNEFREGQFRTTLTSKQKLSKLRGHDIELYLDLERPYPPMLRRPPYQASLETRKEIEKHINELLEMDFIRKIGHNEIMEITTPVLITWHDGKYRLCVDFRALNNYIKADRYPIQRIPHSLDKLEKAKYITKMDCMKGFHQNEVKPNSMKLLRIICHMGIYEYTRMPYGIKNAPSHFQRMMDTIFQEEISEGLMVVYIDDIIIYSKTWEDHVQYIDRVLMLLAVGHEVSGISLAIDQNKVAEVLQKQVPKIIKDMQSFLRFASYYRNQIKSFAHITSSLYKLCSKDVVFEITKERMDSYERIKHELTNAPVLVLPDFELPFKLYIDAACSQGLEAALHQGQIVDGEPREGVICYIYRNLKY